MSRHANVISVRYPVTLRNLTTGVYARAIWTKGEMLRLRDDVSLGPCPEQGVPDGWELMMGFTPPSAPRKLPRKATMINLEIDARKILERLASERVVSMSDIINELIRKADENV